MALTALIGGLVIFSCLVPAMAQSLRNTTITVPVGTTNHGNEHLLCTPSKWSDIAVFFLANYVAHAATVKSTPGESGPSIAVNVLTAFLFPVSGVMRGLRAILQHAATCDHPLGVASKAGALCMVVRTKDWKPQVGDKMGVSRVETPDTLTHVHSYQSSHEKSVASQTDVELGSRGTHAMVEPLQSDTHLPAVKVDPKALRERRWANFMPTGHGNLFSERKVHGICHLPVGYRLSLLSPGTSVKDLEGGVVLAASRAERLHQWQQKGKSLQAKVFSRTARASGELANIRYSRNIASFYSLSRGVIAVFQTIYTSVTLYETRGDQIRRFGYAAFGLTVTPYLIMSIINFIGTVLTPDFPAVYLIRSEVMAEAARRDGAKFEGVVGTLGEDNTPLSHNETRITCVGVEGKRVVLESSNAVDSVNFPVPQRHPRTVNALLEDPSASTTDRVTYYIAPSSYKDIKQYRGYSVLSCFSSVFIGAIAIAVMAALSHFQPGQSTGNQRVWILLWLTQGVIFGPTIQIWLSLLNDEVHWIYWFNGLSYCTSAIGGFVMVVGMLREYGTCVRLF